MLLVSHAAITELSAGCEGYPLEWLMCVISLLLQMLAPIFRLLVFLKRQQSLANG